ncbi:hypothetical protein IVB33_10030 [Bradyrhizobium sp. 24]|uniref:hypothetical protein n=1 Tax=unclassified Bradyrhizobium TaxID=2631580 RepID=UPI001FF89D6B|nr:MULTISPECIES: hypothetical protein [unclassified Bradyrhizobium]MCK1298066.1 hypothetical protein [Bradyrhizobium sp. 37]MCK1378427.1 hypothetical protein [Bradyrhizobium sp. 24]MCK1772806.1 hypothetical protein [Bradyrhizobium sp. 134]
MPATIPEDSTIETVWAKLVYQKDYVSGALQKMRQCTKLHSNSSIKIGVTGTGQRPYYRVTYKSYDGSEQIFGSFYDTHEPLESGFVKSENWSSRSMTFDELLNFYADKIDFKGKRA